MATINGLRIIPMVTYPLRLDGGLANLRYPSRITAKDAERIAAHLRTLIEPEPEIPSDAALSGGDPQ